MTEAIPETIDRERLEQLPPLRLAPSHHLQEGSGNGCAGDPPGYPSYYTRNIYTQYGNNPARGATLAIFGRVLERAEDDHVLPWESGKLRALWRPLPLDHVRTREWIENTYRHMARCYVDDERPEYGRPGTLIFPVPGYKLETFRDDERFSDEYRAKARAAIEQRNADELARAERIAVPANHRAVRFIRKFYPEYEPELDLIENPPQTPTNWWETHETKPTPETCPGQDRWSPPTPHPVNGSWCQVCGWRAV